MKAIFNRRSIRKYTSEPVSPEVLRTIIQSAMAAPSANNTRPWQFVLITDRQLIDQIPAFHPYARMTAQAPVVVAVCGDLSKQPNQAYLAQDCAAATQNMLIAATDSNIGSVWLGVYPREDRMLGLSSLLRLPAHILPLTMVVLGHANEVKPPHNEWFPDMLSVNYWGTKSAL